MTHTIETPTHGIDTERTMTDEDNDPTHRFEFEFGLVNHRGDPVAQTVGENYELIDRENWWAWIACDTADVVDLAEHR